MQESGLVGRDACAAALREIAPIGNRLLALLSLPDSIYRHDSASFSSEPGRTIAAVASAMALGQALPSSFPDYGLHISPLGSSVFCTFVDRSRGVIAYSAIRNMYAGEGSWTAFEDALEGALAEARSLRERGVSFSFVVSTDGGTRMI
ncbi:MAG: hypothetical protein AB1324_03445 [Candidatus Micrarchaeota archaeon]